MKEGPSLDIDKAQDTFPRRKLRGREIRHARLDRGQRPRRSGEAGDFGARAHRDDEQNPRGALDNRRCAQGPACLDRSGDRIRRESLGGGRADVGRVHAIDQRAVRVVDRDGVDAGVGVEKSQ